ncbi:MAG: alpha/beta hydrolase, partial [Desulfobacterales bacterium]|nr:alpha/beta hydrolase [Desulfobacterales bacterium]
MECFDYNGLKIYYKKIGSGRPVIFLHNGGNSHVIWERQISFLSDSHECYAFDLPGYGMSANPGIRYSLSLYTGFLDEFLLRSSLGPVTLVGNCIGSAIALRYAIEKPINVDRLVLFHILSKSTVRDGMIGPVFRATELIPTLR